MTRKLKEGDLVWLNDPGMPYEDWNGASCVVVAVDTGVKNQYVEVRPVVPDANCPSALLHPETVILETRPWLKKNLKQFLKLRTRLLSTARDIVEQYESLS